MFTNSDIVGCLKIIFTRNKAAYYTRKNRKWSKSLGSPKISSVKDNKNAYFQPHEIIEFGMLSTDSFKNISR